MLHVVLALGLLAAAPSLEDAREAPRGNPLLAPWKGPHGGFPPFAEVRVEHFQPALDAAMGEQLAAIEAIASNPAPPTFENTIAALERSGRTLDRVTTVYDIWSSNLSTPEFQVVEKAVAPRLATFHDRILHDEGLFRRVAAVYESRETAGLTPEQKRVAWLHYRNFVRAGAQLDSAGKKRAAAIDERLATLYTSFTQNVLAEEKEQITALEKEADLAGLPDSLRAAFAEAAAARGLNGKWVVANTRSAVEPFLTTSTRRDLREKVWRLFVTRGDHHDAHDNNAIITEILRLRAERARLLGYPTYAHWSVEMSMARTPDRAMELMEAVWPAAVERVRADVAEMKAMAERDGVGTVEPWDYRLYAERLRKAKYDLDEGEVKPYLQLEKLREGMFWVAGELFDLHFTPMPGAPVYHPDVRVWEVKDGAGRHVGVWYLDPYARPGKRSGAWMNAYREQERFDGEVTPIVSNNANFVKGKPGEPELVSWDDAVTLFHEFGHALHGLSSNANYPSVAGTDVPRDYVEFPSQMLERWLSTPEVLNRFALHVATGKPMPPELVAKIAKAATFNQGFETLEYLVSALVDMKAHLAGDRAIEPASFERETLAALGMPAQVVMRHRLPHFQHIFDSDGYAAGYYSYLWADVISADAYEAFLEGKGPYDTDVAARLRRYVFSAGNTVDPAEGYRAFRGHDPSVGALMRKRGFPEPKAKSEARRDSASM